MEIAARGAAALLMIAMPLALGAFLILTFTNISPIWLVLVAAAIGLVFYR